MALRIDGRGERACSRFRRPARDERSRPPLFNQPRPVFLNPIVNAGLIALASLSLGLLRSDVAGRQPPTEIVRAEGDAESLADEVANAPACPEFGRIAEFHRAPLEPAKNSLNLSVGEFGHATERRLAGQPGNALLVVAGLPFLDGPEVNAEELGNFFGRMAVVETLDRQKATTFQLSRGSFASHARPELHSQCQGKRIEKMIT